MNSLAGRKLPFLGTPSLSDSHDSSMDVSGLLPTMHWACLIQSTRLRATRAQIRTLDPSHFVAMMSSDVSWKPGGGSGDRSRPSHCLHRFLLGFCASRRTSVSRVLCTEPGESEGGIPVNTPSLPVPDSDAAFARSRKSSRQTSASCCGQARSASDANQTWGAA